MRYLSSLGEPRKRTPISSATKNCPGSSRVNEAKKERAFYGTLEPSLSYMYILYLSF